MIFFEQLNGFSGASRAERGIIWPADLASALKATCLNAQLLPGNHPQGRVLKGVGEDGSMLRS